MNIKFVPRIGNYSPKDDIYVNSIEDLFKTEHISFAKQQSNFYSYGCTISGDIEIQRILLSACFNWNEEYNGCMNSWVLGYIYGPSKFILNVPYHISIMAAHKPECWVRKYKSCTDDLFSYDRPLHQQLKIAKSMGWERDDLMGLTCYCDCGFDDFKNK